MSNLATINAIYQAFGSGDIPAIVEYLSDNVQWEKWDDNSAQHAEVPWMLPRTGKQGAIEFFQKVAELDIKDFQVLSIMENHNQAAVEFVLEADVPATGRHFRDEEMHLWTFNDAGQVIRLRHYIDTAKHIEAAKP